MRHHLINALYVLSLVAIVVALVYWSGGTATGLPHLMYVPITIGAFRAGKVGGILTGLVAAGAVMLLPLQVATGHSQALATVLVRSSTYLLVGAIVGYMVQRLQQHQASTEDSFLQSVSALVNMLEVNHEYTAGHSVRVAKISRALAAELAYSSGELFQITVGALLHDVGKVAISRDILDKPGRLTAAEFGMVKTHPAEGERILADLQYQGAGVIRDIVRHHHERLDGSGYPDGLSGSLVTPSVRIVAVADVYEALTSDRPYRPGMSSEAAMQIILRDTQLGKFDPDVVRCLHRCVQADRYFYEVGPGSGPLALMRNRSGGDRELTYERAAADR